MNAKLSLPLAFALAAVAAVFAILSIEDMAHYPYREAQVYLKGTIACCAGCAASLCIIFTRKD